MMAEFLDESLKNISKFWHPV